MDLSWLTTAGSTSQEAAHVWRTPQPVLLPRGSLYRVRSSLRRRTRSEIGTVERASEKRNANTPHLPRILHTVTRRAFRKFSFADRRAPETANLDPKPINAKLFSRTPAAEFPVTPICLSRKFVNQFIFWRKSPNSQ